MIIKNACNIEKSGTFWYWNKRWFYVHAKFHRFFFCKWKKHVRFYCFFVWQKHNAYKYVALTDIYAIFLINEVPVNITYAISIYFGSQTEHWMWEKIDLLLKLERRGFKSIHHNIDIITHILTELHIDSVDFLLYVFEIILKIVCSSTPENIPKWSWFV